MFNDLNKNPGLKSFVIIRPKKKFNLKGIGNDNQRKPIDIFKSILLFLYNFPLFIFFLLYFLDFDKAFDDFFAEDSNDNKKKEENGNSRIIRINNNINNKNNNESLIKPIKPLNDILNDLNFKKPAIKFEQLDRNIKINNNNDIKTTNEKNVLIHEFTGKKI